MEKLIDQLQRDHLITADQARVVKMESFDRRIPVQNVLLESEFITAAALAHYTSGALMLSLQAEEFIPDENALALISENCARRFNLLPISLNLDSNIMVIAMADPSNVVARDTVRREVDSNILVEYRRANTTDIKQTLDKCYGSSYSLQGVLAELDQQGEATATSADQEVAPVVRLTDAVLQDAITRRASDIHLSPEQFHIQIRYRIDGVLTLVCSLHVRYWPAMLVRLKVLSNIDIAETRVPQDGHFSRNVHGQIIDFRVATFPLQQGENMVLRVLDRRRGLISLAELCNNQSIENRLRKMIERPSGLIVVCGPTGSGKTTTLYALLRSLDATALNIMTLEDPIEYPISSIRQTRVQAATLFDYADGVRGVLRQDPDVILVGEIRDADSCAMTCRAALTGHLVLTTIHADDAVGAIHRLIELGVERSLVASVLSGVVAQRLLRKKCTRCHSLDDACSTCEGTGYSGRVALFECLILSTYFSSMLQRGDSSTELHQQAVEDGMLPMIDAAQIQLNQGTTTVEEIRRVFGDVSS